MTPSGQVKVAIGKERRRLGLNFRHICFGFSPDYLDAAADIRTKGLGGIFELQDEQGVAYVPGIIFHRRFLRVLILTATPIDQNGQVLSPPNQLQVLELLGAHLRRTGLVHRIAQPTNWCVFQSIPSRAKWALFGSYVLPLVKDQSQLFAGLHGKHRNVIRRAEKMGAIVKQGKDQLHAFYRLYQNTMHRNAMPHEPMSYFQALLNSADFHTYCGVAYAQDIPVSTLFAPFNSHGAYYMYGGTAHDIRINGANNLLHFEAIKHFATHGSSFYDFVGARLGDVKNPRLRAIQNFKLRFGGPLQRGALWKKDLSPWSCHVFDALAGIRSLARGGRGSGDIIDQEFGGYTANGSILLEDGPPA